MSDSGSVSRLAVITGASSGIGEATARALAGTGFTVALGASREGRIKKLVEKTDGHARVLEMTDRN